MTIKNQMETRRVVTESGCIEWTGPTHHRYGHMWHNGKVVSTHRIAWELAHGPIPDGLWVLHKCDNPPCMNVDHLWLGTGADNIADRVAKGRTYNGKAEITHCLNGHEFNESNTYRRGNCRQCKACGLARTARYRAERKAKMKDQDLLTYLTAEVDS